MQSKDYYHTVTKYMHVVTSIKRFLEISSSSHCSFGVKQQSLTSLFIYQTLFLVVFEYFDDVYLFEIKHVCKLNWPKRPSELLSFRVRRLLSITPRTLVSPTNILILTKKTFWQITSHSCHH
jgi:hypothetical protein